MKRVEKALRLGQAAAELGTSRYGLMRLCQLAMVEAERTPGGHWRIPCSEIERLKAEGLPTVPALMSAEEAEDPRSRRPSSDPPDGLYRDASLGLAESAESVLIAEHAVRRRQLDLERVKVEDEFAARAERQADREAELRRQAAAAQARREHDQFIRKTLDQAADLIANFKTAAAKMQNPVFPLGWPFELDLRVHEALVKALQDTYPGSMPDQTISDLISYTVTELVVSFRERQLQEIQTRRDSDYRQYLDSLKVIIELANALRR
jgi:hypothetical protein